jgi:cytochrome P450
MSEHRSEAEALVFNPFDAAVRADPYPVYRRMREEEPTHRSPLGFHVFTRYDDCLTVLRHPQMSSDGRNAAGFAEFLEQQPAARKMAKAMEGKRPFLLLDPPDHTRLRGLVSKAFTPRTVEGLRPRIQQVVDELLDAVEPKGAMEVVEDLAYPLPVVIICEMLGVPASDHERFKGWSRDLARGLDPDFVQPAEALERRFETVLAFHEYFRDLIARRRSDPGADVLTALVHAEEQGDTLTEDEVLGTCTLLLVAGHETTVNLIGNGVLALLRHRDQLAKLRADPTLIKSAVEEILRYDPPVQFDARVATTDIEVGGVTVAQGEQPLLILAAANRDPQQFDAPDTLDITRVDNRHLSFGHGAHFCLGAPLARLEGQLALGTLAERLPRMEPAADVPVYKENLILRGLAALPVTF